MSVDALSGDMRSRRVTDRFGHVAESAFVTHSVVAVRGPIS